MNLDLRKVPAIYINLARDVEKNEYMKNMLTELGFETIIRIEASEFPSEKHLAGCSLSHFNALNEVDVPFIVFEDDCRVKNFYPIIQILYLSQEYASLCSKISIHASKIADHQDIGFAEVQRYYNVYAFDEPMFYQTSSNGTDQKLTTYSSVEVFQPLKQFWKPTALY